jgi:hypothetical protein
MPVNDLRHVNANPARILQCGIALVKPWTNLHTPCMNTLRPHVDLGTTPDIPVWTLFTHNILAHIPAKNEPLPPQL